MSRSGVSCAVVICLGMSAAASAVFPQAAVRAGTEFQVNSITADRQSSSSVGMEADGGFVVVWASYGSEDGDGTGIFARRFDSTGTGLGSQFQVNSHTPNAQDSPAVAMEGAGGFVVAWNSYLQDGAGNGIFARRFDSTGVGQGSEFQVNTRTLGPQASPSVAMGGDGDFVVAWQSYPQDGSFDGIFAQRFDAMGAPQSLEFQVNSRTTNNQRGAAAAMDADGDFVVAWHSFGQDGYDVFAQRFDANGMKEGVELQVNSFTTSSQLNATAGMSADGGFVVAWESFNQDASNDGIFARRFDAAGVAQGPDFQVNSYATDSQASPAVDVGDDGDFVVAWHSLYQDGSDDGVFAQRFDAAGVPQGAELLVNSHTQLNQSVPAVGIDGEGDFVVTYASEDLDGSGFGVFAQRFVTPAVLDIDANGTVGALTDGLLVLRFLFGFTGATLTSGAVAGDCIRCDAAAIEPYLQTLI